MEKSEAIGKRLKIAREQAGLSQSQVAKMLNVHRPTISEMEAGRRKISAEELVDLSKIYDVRMTWLACAEEDDIDERRDRIEIAARKLSKMNNEELNQLIDLLSTLRQDDDLNNM